MRENLTSGSEGGRWKRGDATAPAAYPYSSMGRGTVGMLILGLRPASDRCPESRLCRVPAPVAVP